MNDQHGLLAGRFPLVESRSTVCEARRRAPVAARGWLAGSLLAVASGAGVAQEPTIDPVLQRTPEDWIETMESAFRNLDYDGVFSYSATTHSELRVTQQRGQRTLGFSAGLSNTKLATFRIVHKVVDGVERERIVGLDGPHREIVRTGEEIVYVLESGDELLNLGEAIPGPYARNLMVGALETGDHYRMEVSGGGRVAGRKAVRLDIVPVAGDRFAHRLWLDEATSLLLRSELRDTFGRQLEMMQFTSLRLGNEVALEDLEPSVDGVRVTRQAQHASGFLETGDSHWASHWSPPGFRVTRADSRQDPTDVDVLTFSDGLASYSVFIETMPEAGAGSVTSRNGATVVLTHVASCDSGDHLVTVVGEIPESTARQVAAGFCQGP
ncbi:MAG: hypothetical protein F4X98_04685 [Gammaproteobacteria bacterium]|nr:hypothetical protein [Gammaproteobacteria bacterium]